MNCLKTPIFFPFQLFNVSKVKTSKMSEKENKFKTNIPNTEVLKRTKKILSFSYIYRLLTYAFMVFYC